MGGTEGHGVVSMFLHQLSYLGTSCETGTGPNLRNGSCPAPCQRDAPAGLACRGRLSQLALLTTPNPD